VDAAIASEEAELAAKFSRASTSNVSGDDNQCHGTTFSGVSNRVQNRLPKSVRVLDAVQKKRVTERSIAIIESVARYRFIRTSDIIRLVGGNEDVTHRHLQQLYHATS